MKHQLPRFGPDTSLDEFLRQSNLEFLADLKFPFKRVYSQKLSKQLESPTNFDN